MEVGGYKKNEIEKIYRLLVNIHNLFKDTYGTIIIIINGMSILHKCVIMKNMS